MHHLHAVFVELGLLLLPLGVGDGLFLLALACLHHAADEECGKKDTCTSDGTNDNTRLGSCGQAIPEAVEARGLFDFLENS